MLGHDNNRQTLAFLPLRRAVWRGRSGELAGTWGGLSSSSSLEDATALRLPIVVVVVVGEDGGARRETRWGRWKGARDETRSGRVESK